MRTITVDVLAADLHTMAGQLDIDMADAVVSGESRFEDLGMDSLEVIDFMVFLEKKYQVKVTDEQLAAIDTCGDVLSVLNEVAVVP